MNSDVNFNSTMGNVIGERCKKWCTKIGLRVCKQCLEEFDDPVHAAPKKLVAVSIFRCMLGPLAASNEVVLGQIQRSQAPREGKQKVPM